MTLAELQTLIPTATADTWHQHLNGGGWVANSASVPESATVPPTAIIGPLCSLGKGCSLGEDASDAIDLGAFEGWRKVIYQKNGIAFIGAGCYQFTLAEARAHWVDREDRQLTRAMLLCATEIARLKGWREAL